MDSEGGTGWLAEEGMSKRLKRERKKHMGSGSSEQWTAKEGLDGLLRRE